MTELVRIFMTLFQPVGIALSMAYVYGLIARHKLDGVAVRPIMGLVLGLAAVASMSSPVEISDGFLIDSRLVFVALAFAYFDVQGGIIALVIAGVTRFAIGGDGMTVGLTAMCSVAACGLAWSKFIRSRGVPNVAATLLLATVVAMHALIGLLLPQAARQIYMANIAPFSFVVQFVGTLALGLLLTRERLQIIRVQTLQTASQTDGLTGVLNRAAIREFVDGLNSRPQAPRGRALLLMDIDRFKIINDTYGHPAGDAVLVQFVQRIRDCLREGDLFSRLGGDEFSVLLPDTAAGTAEIIANRCRKAVSDTAFEIDDQILDLTVSIGVSWTPLQASFDHHSASADHALYHAKRNGRNYTCVGSPLLVPAAVSLDATA
ncbi:diguanylate cyclase [Loktanella sp. 3ANDIMAR09]|uniref:GGDEF domain-containing protein n=1 Tax=Loktanella sp. 3ANDIMAR09 TaxID=1225657 RepID=UPI0006FCE3C8|nr:diguanylate cyclase [Loktanella sp. 3ANDIMAR09]